MMEALSYTQLLETNHGRIRCNSFVVMYSCVLIRNAQIGTDFYNFVKFWEGDKQRSSRCAVQQNISRRSMRFGIKPESTSNGRFCADAQMCEVKYFWVPLHMV
ncbi:unnamed protein product [Ixodes persulcatus]